MHQAINLQDFVNGIIFWTSNSNCFGGGGGGGGGGFKMRKRLLVHLISRHYYGIDFSSSNGGEKIFY